MPTASPAPRGATWATTSLADLNDPREAVAWLRTPQAVRRRCNAVLAAAERDALAHFALDRDRLDVAATYVVDTIRADYPTLDIPTHSRWRHFAAGGRDRWAGVCPAGLLRDRTVRKHQLPHPHMEGARPDLVSDERGVRVAPAQFPNIGAIDQLGALISKQRQRRSYTRELPARVETLGARDGQRPPSPLGFQLEPDPTGIEGRNRRLTRRPTDSGSQSQQDHQDLYPTVLLPSRVCRCRLRKSRHGALLWFPNRLRPSFSRPVAPPSARTRSCP